MNLTNLNVENNLKFKMYFLEKMNLTLRINFCIFTTISKLDKKMLKINTRNKIIIFISFFATLTAIGAYLKIPLPHIPITLQTFFVIMSGNLLGFKFGFISQLLYLTVGLLGIPVFAYGGGPGYIFQPTFGYLLGYPFCAFTIGMLLKLFFAKFEIMNISKVKAFLLFFVSDITGLIVIFIFGLAYLYINLKLGLYFRLDQLASANFDWDDTLTTAVMIFIPIDFVKAFLASWLMVSLRKLPIFPVAS